MRITQMFGTLRVECEGDLKECFIELSSAAEVFGQDTCGNCNSKNLVPSAREHDGNQFFEMRCSNCGCCLGFGQRKQDGKLFPRRKGKDGEWLACNGWIDWRQARQQEPEFSNF